MEDESEQASIKEETKAYPDFSAIVNEVRETFKKASGGKQLSDDEIIKIIKQKMYSDGGESKTLRRMAEEYEKVDDLDNASFFHECADKAKVQEDKTNSELMARLNELSKKYAYDSANMYVTKEMASLYEQLHDYNNAYSFYNHAYELSGHKDDELLKRAKKMKHLSTPRSMSSGIEETERELEEKAERFKEESLIKKVRSNPHYVVGVGDWVKQYTDGEGHWNITKQQKKELARKCPGLMQYITSFGDKPLEAQEVELAAGFNPANRNAGNNGFQAPVDIKEEEETQNVCQRVSKAFVRGDITSEEAAETLDGKRKKTMDELLPDAITDKHVSETPMDETFKQMAEQIAQGVMEGAITPEEATDFLDGKGKMSDNIMAYLATAKDRQRNTVKEDFNSDEWKEKREKWNKLFEYLSKYGPKCLWQTNKGVFPDYEYSFLLDDGEHSVSGRTLVDWVNSKNNEYVIIKTTNDSFKVLVKENFRNRPNFVDDRWFNSFAPRGIFSIGEGVDITYDKKTVESIEPITAHVASENTYIVHYRNGDTVKVKVGFPTTTQEEAVEAKVDPLIEFFQLPKDEVIRIIETNLTLGSMWGLESFALDTPHHRYGFLVARTEEQAEKAFRASAMQKLFEQPAETLAKVCGADKELILKLKNGNYRSAIYGIMEATNSFERYYDEMKRQYGRGHWIAKDGNEIKMDCGYYLYFH